MTARQSAIRHPQSPIPDGDDWLPLTEAPKLTGLSARSWRRRAAFLASQHLARKAPAPGGGKSVWWVHRSAHPRLARCPGFTDRDRTIWTALLERYPQQYVERAYRRAYWMHQWRRRCTFPRSAAFKNEWQIAVAVAAEAQSVEGDDFRISARSLHRWWKAYSRPDDHGRPRGVEALVDGYSASRCDSESARSPQAIEYFYSIWHGQARHSIKTCHDAVLWRAEKQGWSWPASYAATVRWLHSHENRAESSLHRHGTGHYSRRYMSHLQVDYTALEPGERYVLDHARADFWCSYNDRRIRPWLTAALDCRSRVIVGWHWGPVPHQDAIIACLRMAFRDWSIPQRVHIDQGKDFTSELLTGCTKHQRRRYRRELGPDWRNVLRHQMQTFWLGVLGELGIEITEATPHHPWAKGLIERWFSTVHDQFDKTFITYCGANAERKPECVEILRAAPDVPTLDEVRVRFADYLRIYHHAPHRGLEGRFPLAVWSTASRLRKAKESELTALLQARGIYRVGPNGVTFRIGGASYTYGGNSARLRAYVGRDVYVTLDPDDCSYCCAFTAQREGRRFIDRLACNIPVPANTSIDELRAAIATLRRRNRDLDRAQRQAPKRLRTAAQEVAAMRRERAAALRRTGTDNLAPAANIRVVRTGFEGASTPPRTELCRPSEEFTDAARRLADFARRKDDPEPADSAWSRLHSFVQKEKSDG